MASYNRATVIGNVVRDIEIKELSGDYQVGNLSLAINDKRKDRNGQCVQETTYVDVQLWNNTAKAVQTYAPKGKSVLVEGRLKTNTWEQNGQKRSKLILVGEKVVFLGQKDGEQSHGSKQSGSNRSSYGTAPKGYTSGQNYEEEPDIPF